MTNGVNFIDKPLVNITNGFYVVLFECDRCTRLVKGEERYLLMDFFYCRACFITITHDPDYNIFLERIKILSRLPRFE